MTDQELKDLIASLAIKSDRLDAAQARTDAQMAETDRKLNKLSELYGGGSDRFDAAQARTDTRMAETYAQMARTDAQMAETDRKLNKLSELYGGVSDNQGSAAEEFFFNTLNAKPVIGNITYDRVTPNLVASKPGSRFEFDIVLVNGSSVAVIEVKHKAHLSSLDQLEKQLQRYRESFPEHANYKLYGGVAGLSVPQDTIDEAHKRGLFVLKQQGDAFAVDASAMRAFG